MTFTTSIFCSYALLNRNSSLRESKIRITEICSSNPFRKYYAKKHSRRVHLWLCFVFSCSLLRGLDMERQHISRSYMGYLICHHSGSLPCRYVGIPTAVVSDLTLNMAFSIYLPYRFSAIYFSAM